MHQVESAVAERRRPPPPLSPLLSSRGGYAHPGGWADAAVYAAAHMEAFRARRTLMAWSRLAAAATALRGSFKLIQEHGASNRALEKLRRWNHFCLLRRRTSTLVITHCCLRVLRAGLAAWRRLPAAMSAERSARAHYTHILL